MQLSGRALGLGFIPRTLREKEREKATERQRGRKKERKDRLTI